MALPNHERNAILFVLRHVVYGAAAALTFGGCLLIWDVGGIGTLTLASDDWLLSMVLLFGGLFVTFGSLAIGVGVMSLGEDSF
ncbi:hypothetical protein F1188_01570 [Roseospira marina]|uniref:Uncharacterized protein n=1 Tax=Roseospira marina TaxID=140057 RepID=A0A5M6IGP7_9PROT|nr:hypothetical protein [Roseospira marina]KAA5607480.1 hypothetical protein F1188_01570 [Roseospira marina]MBB4312339.1 hypothetical protein [Roseospira marina]MBB5085645.1 hypothetical protein [Roseospira marina]